MLILIIAACLAVIICLPELLEVFPTLVGCIFRAHESENLASSVSLSRSRDRLCRGLLIPSLLVAAGYDLYAPLARVEEPLLKVLILFGIFVGYALFRLLLRTLLRHTRGCACMDERRWKCVTRVPFSFFAILEMLLCATAGIAALLHTPADTLRDILLWECAAVYVLCLIRKTQIFAQYRGIFSSFLYLCTLEILPTGLLIFTAIKF